MKAGMKVVQLDEMMAVWKAVWKADMMVSKMAEYWVE